MALPLLKRLPVRTPGVMAAKLLLPWGSAWDAAGERGSHQLLASCLSRGCGPLDHLQLADRVEGRGAGLRSDAHEDGLLISLRCTVEDADELLPLLGWMVTEPHLNLEQVELERSLSLQALQRQREDPFQVGIDSWRRLAYGNGGYGHDPLGTRADLESLPAERLSTLSRRLATGPSVLVLAGCWPEQLQDDLSCWQGFNNWPTDPPQDALDNLQPIREPKRGARIVATALDTEQVVLTLGQPSCPHGHRDDLALRLLQSHLGSGMSSLLFQRLREEHGVAYDVGAYLPARRDAAPFVLHASSSADRAELALTLLLDSWDELSDRDLTSDELELARAKYRGQVAHASQTASQRAERSAQLQGLGLPDDHDQQCLNKLEALTPADLRQAARRWLNQPELSLCGPGSILKRLESLWQRRQSATGSS